MVRLFKREVSYKDKDGKDRRGVNFYLSNEEGKRLIPIEVKYFPKDQFDGRDPDFQGKKGFLEGLAETLPDKPSDTKKEG